MFKALGRTLRQAVAIDPDRRDEIPSTKGVLCMIAIVDYGVGNLFSLQSSLAMLARGCLPDQRRGSAAPGRPT